MHQQAIVRTFGSYISKASIPHPSSSFQHGNPETPMWGNVGRPRKTGAVSFLHRARHGISHYDDGAFAEQISIHRWGCATWWMEPWAGQNHHQMELCVDPRQSEDAHLWPCGKWDNEKQGAGRALLPFPNTSGKHCRIVKSWDENAGEKKAANNTSAALFVIYYSTRQ